MTVLGLTSWTAVRTWPRPLEISGTGYPSAQLAEGELQFPYPTSSLIAVVGRFDSELSAYLWFDYLRSRSQIQQSQVLLTATERLHHPVYRIFLVLRNNAVEVIPYLETLRAEGFISGYELVFCTPAAIAYDRAQTNVFIAAYKRPASRDLAAITDDQLAPSIARFLIFKSSTDPRTRMGNETQPLSNTQASELAADIIAVAKFYDLPLEVFLGIGAMENNYLSIRGDLQHSIWKRRAAKGDIVLKRRRHRVLVSDYSIGVWQITRETLRYAHALYLRDLRSTDARDYSQLPERLRPPTSLELDLTDTHLLTTYAGLILRDLLDRFDGDVQKAVGAYNGGPRNPNLQYAAGVQIVAEYARSILERVAAVPGTTVSPTAAPLDHPRQPPAVAAECGTDAGGAPCAQEVGLKVNPLLSAQ